jgi:hypothetical protein
MAERTHTTMTEIRVRTESGSLYILNQEGTWERVEETENSGPLRTDGGVFFSAASRVADHVLIITGPPIRKFALARLIITSPAVTESTCGGVK